MFSIEMVEGQDHPSQLSELFSEAGKTGGLLLQMLQCYFATGRNVVLDSGFCVLKAIVALKKHGVFASALIKKRRYWPTLIAGNAMKSMFDGEDKRVGDFLGISGSLDGEDYFLWGMKEPDYVMKMMATGRSLLATQHCQEVKRKWTNRGVVESRSFRYPCPIDWHYKFRHAIDDHNNLCHSMPSINIRSRNQGDIDGTSRIVLPCPSS
jgi:hypothetical protein